MKRFEALKAVTIKEGLVELDKKQARRRRHLINPVGELKEEGVFEVLKPFQFKAGETFGYEGNELSPAVATLLNPELDEVDDLPEDELMDLDDLDSVEEEVESQDDDMGFDMSDVDDGGLLKDEEPKKEGKKKRKKRGKNKKKGN